MPKLSPRTIAAAHASETDRFIFDSELAGFALKITPFGRKSFIYQYWSPVERTKRRKYNIGTLGDTLRRPDGATVALTAYTARAEAERLRGLVRDKRDPFLELQAAARDAETAIDAARVTAASERPVREIAADMIAELTAKLEAKDEGQRRSPRTVAEYKRLLDKHILPLIGDRPIAKVGKSDAEAVRRQKYKLTVRKAPAKVGAKPTTVVVERVLSAQPVLWNRVQQLGRSLINYAERIEARPVGLANPFGGKRWHTEGETRETLTTDEITALHHALEQEDIGDRGGAVDAIRFLLFSGMRKSEALSLRWDAVDADTGIVRLKHTKTGLSVRPLSKEALRVLAGIPRNGPFVFASPNDQRKPRTEIKRVWLRVRKSAGITKPMHCLRHTMASVALSAGVPLAAVGAILGHKRHETTMRYAKFDPAIAKKHADVAGAALGRSAAPADVTDINSRRKSGNK